MYRLEIHLVCFKYSKGRKTFAMFTCNWLKYLRQMDRILFYLKSIKKITNYVIFHNILYHILKNNTIISLLYI